MIPGVVVLQPRVIQHVIRGYPFLRFPPEESPDHAAGLRRKAIGHRELAAADLGEERGVLRIVERISEREGREIFIVKVWIRCRFMSFFKLIYWIGI